MARDATIGPLRPFEIAKFLELLSEFRNTQNLPATLVDSRKAFDATFSKRRKLAVHAARVNGDLIGFVTFRTFYEPSAGVQGIHLCDLFVKLGHRRDGIGRRLLESVQRACVRNKGQFVWWMTSVTNSDAVSFFARCCPASQSLALSFSWHP